MCLFSNNVPSFRGNLRGLKKAASDKRERDHTENMPNPILASGLWPSLWVSGAFSFKLRVGLCDLENSWLHWALFIF